ncbi:MAG: hypothetical protein IJC74_05585 [Clostridia bacterium]|nr:hypothetical protein [Clostridia bacterium]
MFYFFYDYFKNKYFNDIKDLPAEKREALIFKRTCEKIPVSIKKDDLIAGWYGCENGKDYAVTDNKDFPFIDAYSKEERETKNYLEEKFGINIRFDKGHTCIDYGNIIKNGLKSYEIKIKNELKKDNLTESKQILLEAMLIALDSVNIYTKRFSDLAGEMYKNTKEERLLKIQNALLKVPYEPCENIYEAISAVWIMHTLIPVSDNAWWSISLGRIDQFLYPLYEKSLAGGETKENVKAYLKNLFLLLNSYGDGACALNIGGMDKDGKDMMNPLSELLIEVEKEMRMTSPIFVARINPNTPDEIIDKCIDIKLFNIGQPTFYGDIPCRKALINRGVPEENAVDFSVNSCMGLHISGEEIASMWGCVFNMHLPLELTINKGKGIFYDLPFKTEAYDTPDSLENLLKTYENHLRSLLKVSFEFNRKNALNCAVNSPNPLLSAITANCIESGLDRAIGAKYNTETVETMALANTTNAICAIDTLVFKSKKYTLEQYINATKNDFDGYDEILSDIKKCEKYGTNSKYADSIALQLVEMTAKICKEMSYDNVYFIPSLHTLDSNVHFGNNLYTTLDGRLKGTPVAKNAGPTNDVRTPDPTSLMISAANIRQELFSGGQPVDLYFDKSTLETKDRRDKIKALIRTYFEMGGLQIQVNSPDIELLEKAYDNPEAYPELVVRIGGYSCKFNSLSKNVQKEFIERFKKEKGI